MLKFYRNLKIGTKVILFVVTLVLIALIGELIVASERNKIEMANTCERELNQVADHYETLIMNHLGRLESFLTKAANDEALINYIENDGSIYVEPDPEEVAMFIEMGLDPPEPEVRKLSLPEKFAGMAQFVDEKDLYMVNKANEIIYQRGDQSLAQFFQTNKEEVFSDKKGFFISNLYKESDSAYYVFCSYPIIKKIDKHERVIGKLVIKSDFLELWNSFSDSTGLGKSGEVLFSLYHTNRTQYINPSRFNDTVPYLKLKIDTTSHPAYLAATNSNGFDEFIDHNKSETFALWRYMPRLNIGMVVKINKDEIFGANSGLNVAMYVISGLIFLLALILTSLFSRAFVSPLLRLRRVLGLVSQGVLPKSIKSDSKDEIGDMTSTVNDLVLSLRKTADFANQIGQGKFEADFKPVSKNDTLGMALVDMRESLQKADRQDNLRNWIVTGVAEIGEILRNNDNLESLGDEVTAYICERVKAVQGAFYCVNDEDEANIFIEMKASYAYKRKKYLQAEYKFAEGLIGQAAIEQDTILRTEVPEDYVRVTSGLLGETKPNCLLIVPLITNETVYGVLEFASFRKFEDGEVQFVQEVSEIIARTIFNLKVNERTRKLLEESQRMSSELQVQQEELRQNAVEMEATQEELKRTNQQLEHQIEEVNRAQKRMQVLLENASEVITIYEKDGTIRYVSPSVENILGYIQEDLIGISDIKYVQKKWQKDIKEMFNAVIKKPEEQVTLQFTYTKKNGELIWLEATGRNMLEDPAIQGIVLNSSDITERRRAEEEERKRGQMQALSENSPDLITRLSDKGNFFYMNPMIKNLTGLDKEYFANKNINEVNLNQAIIEEWTEIVKNVIESNSKVSKEMDFPAVDSDRIMRVNAIPEYSEENEIESVLVVSHDITEQKQIENVIRDKNKKINDSINYAERIQDAILPNSDIVKRDLPNSFIYFLPRDVVSGDFPWYQKAGDDILISAVDCTGHGVPGALISIIGYFLLQDVVDQGIHQPGQVLDALDHKVTKTLRQDEEDSKLKDGMDIGFCKVNMKKMEVQYAGAHRPLYHIRKGELTEYKGNRFPIGGGDSYTNKTNFTNHVIKVKEGDTIYFFSDGYPDQFGGPENRKFGPKRIKEMVSTLKYKDFDEVRDKMDKAFVDWRGDYKQTDDVLLIGIKF